MTKLQRISVRSFSPFLPSPVSRVTTGESKSRQFGCHPSLLLNPRACCAAARMENDISLLCQHGGGDSLSSFLPSHATDIARRKPFSKRGGGGGG